MRLESLIHTQISFQTEVSAIRNELSRLRNQTRPLTPPTPTAPVPPGGTRPHVHIPPPPSFGYSEASTGSTADHETPKPSFVSDYLNRTSEKARADLEKFIGENLISKIGIIVLVLGFGIFAKYAVDNDLISPVARIALGYAAGVALIVFALRLKSKYYNFSAVLMSGGLATMYFITYFAYTAYGLLPQPVAFGLMAMFTVFTVAAALLYSRQVIAHIGLVGAYAVPFLLSRDAGNYAGLFTYMAVINVGILAIALKKSWRAIFYTASGFTWLIFGSWFALKYTPAHFELALTFLGLFFAILYSTKIVHGMIHRELSDGENIVSIIATAVIFFIFALAIGDPALATSQYWTYFSFIGVFALAILLTSYNFYGRVLVFVTFPMTWVIFGAWFANHYLPDEHFTIAWVAALTFFLIYYVSTLVYRLVTDEIGTAESTAFLMTNSFVFYGFGYAIMDSRAELQQWEGLYTAANAVFHSLVVQIVSRWRAAAVDVVQCLVVLIVTFTTISIPIQFDGRPITLVWSVEAVALLYFARLRGARFFEYLGYPVMALAAVSLMANWGEIVNVPGRTPFLNGDVITGLVFVACAAAFYRIDKRSRDLSVLPVEFSRAVATLLAGVAVFAFYNTFRIEIAAYFGLARQTPGLSGVQRMDLNWFDTLAQMNYTALFLTLMGIVALRFVRSLKVAVVDIALSVFTIGIVSTVGMFAAAELRASYVTGETLGLFGTSGMNIAARYVTYTFIGALLVVLFEYTRDSLLDGVSARTWRSLAFDALLYPTLLVVSSCELINDADQMHLHDADKYGLSILWGIFALALISLGMWKMKKHLRIAGIALLAVTLLKLFFYDITELGTIPKTLLFVSLGLLLLFVSFLYNKYKAAIFPAEVEP
ncbi:MAG: DUF2339 domain-containing protein [Pyrinomonadaceae bacterium]